MNTFEAMDSVYIIAEIGVNHNGDTQLAKKMIDAAKEAGANAVKFQTFEAKRLALPDTPKVEYQLNATNSESHYEMLEMLELSQDDHLYLLDYCNTCRIDFISTPYDVVSAKFLNAIGVKCFKTASADLVDHSLHHYIASTGKSSIIATGMASLEEIEQVVKIYKKFNNNNIVLLHCVSNYPCSDHALNMRSMVTMRQCFDLPVGFSDHSDGAVAGIMSVAFGSKVIEKHFTLDRNMPGPDHKASSTPEEFSYLVKSIRRAETMMGRGYKFCQPEEREMALVSKKSIVLKRFLQAGSFLTEGDIEFKRPGAGISPVYAEEILGRVLKHDCNANYQLKWTDLES
jgi:N,N'-diacetyllegionaminate synthase